MIFMWWMLLIAICFVPFVTYFLVTKAFGGEPLILKEKAKK